jgi:hypothetical protein
MARHARRKPAGAPERPSVLSAMPRWTSLLCKLNKFNRHQDDISREIENIETYCDPMPKNEESEFEKLACLIKEEGEDIRTDVHDQIGGVRL